MATGHHRLGKHLIDIRHFKSFSDATEAWKKNFGRLPGVLAPNTTTTSNSSCAQDTIMKPNTRAAENTMASVQDSPSMSASRCQLYDCRYLGVKLTDAFVSRLLILPDSQVRRSSCPAQHPPLPLFSLGFQSFSLTEIPVERLTATDLTAYSIWTTRGRSFLVCLVLYNRKCPVGNGLASFTHVVCSVSFILSEFTTVIRVYPDFFYSFFCRCANFTLVYYAVKGGKCKGEKELGCRWCEAQLFGILLC